MSPFGESHEEKPGSAFDNARLEHEDPQELLRLLDLADSTTPIEDAHEHDRGRPVSTFVDNEPPLTQAQRGASLDAWESARRKKW